MTAVFGITGWKNSGKTTLTSRLVEEFRKRGKKVSTVKHAHRSFKMDHTGTDSHAHRKAGAYEVAVVSGNRWALLHQGDDEESPIPLAEMLDNMAPCDLVLIEGFKTSAHPKIECQLGTPEIDPVWKSNPSIRAVASSQPDDTCTLPGYHIDAIGEIADFIERELGWPT